MGVQRQSKQEYMARLQGRYLKARTREKGRLFDEVVTVTGYHRRHAVAATAGFQIRSWRPSRGSRRWGSGGGRGVAGHASIRR